MPRFILLLLILSAPLFATDEAAHSFHLTSLYHVGYWVRDIAKSRAFYHDFLGFAEPYLLNYPDGTLQMAVMKVNERQVIYLFPNAAKIQPNGDNLDHLGLETDDVAAVREHLLAVGVKVGEVHRGRIGDLLLGLKDPDGHGFEITQLAPEGQLRQHQGQGLPASRISDRLLSASLAVADLPAALHFYQDILGFKKIAGAATGGVRLQVPDGSGCFDLMPYEKKPGEAPARGVPEYCLEVADAAKTVELLTARAKATGFSLPTPLTVAADGSRQTSCVDPDGTRVVFREKTQP
jgi:catechol 2,3-dioxygenase-like lactoylglutathione lyase family enzyme